MKAPRHHADPGWNFMHMLQRKRLGGGNGCRGTDHGIFRRIMVHEAKLQMMRDDIQLVRRQGRPDALRHFNAAKIGKLWVALAILVEARAHHAEIEGGIMRNHRRIAEVVDELFHHLGKFRRVFHIMRANAMHGDVERGKPHILGPDQPFLYPLDHPILYPRQPHGAGAAALLIGGFKIDGDGLQAVIPG